MHPILTTARLSALVFGTALALAACSGNGIKPSPVDPTYSGMGGPGDPNQTRLGGEDSGVLFGKNKSQNQGGGPGAGIGVNAFLWRGTLDTLSFMPLNSADPFGGVIITDWYTPPATSGERFKATAYILTKDLRSDGVRLNVFRQVLQDGQWVDAPVSPRTVGDIEDKILEKARKLREAQTPSNS